MENILEKVMAKFAADISNLVEIDVPKWELSFWVRPKMTIRQRDQIFTKPDGGNYSGHMSMARCVMLLALNKKGERVFSEFELDNLVNNVGADVVSEIALKMFAATDAQVPDDERVSAAKNSSKATS